MKRKGPADFGDILAAFDQPAAARCTHSAAAPAGAERESAQDHQAPRGRSPVWRMLGNVSFPWPSDVSSILGGFGWRSQRVYAEEATDAEPEPATRPPLGAVRSGARFRRWFETRKTEDEGVAKELGLGPGLGLVDLKRIRRDFAKKNHPDRFEPEKRGAAERRMAIANMLIDELMRQNREPHG